MRESMRGTGVVVNGLWVFTGDKLACKWKSIDPLKDPGEHTNIGTVVQTGYAVHPKTGRIESGFALRDITTDVVDGYAESMIVHLGFLQGLRGQVQNRAFPKVFGQGSIIIPDRGALRDRV